MPAPITLSLDINEQREIARFTELPPNLLRALVGRLTPVEQRMLGRVQAVVPRRTGKLLSEIRGFVDTGPDWVRVRVRVVVDKNAGRGGRGNYDAGKAAAIEYGARTTAHVRAFRRKRGENVQAYQRRVVIAARNYLRGPFAATTAEATTAIKAAIDDATIRK